MSSWDSVSLWYLSETFPLPEEPKSYNRAEICYQICVPSDTALESPTVTLYAIDIRRIFSDISLTLKPSLYDDLIQLKGETRTGYYMNKYDSEEPDDMGRNGF